MTDDRRNTECGAAPAETQLGETGGYGWLDAYLSSFPGVEKDYKLEWQWHRYMLRGKLFAAVCAPGPQYRTYGGHELVNLSCDPRMAELWRAEYPEVLPGFYTEKTSWNAVLLDGALPGEALQAMCDHAWQRVLGKLTKKAQREILSAEPERRYPCPCCGQLTFPVPKEEAIAYICPVCFWENDVFDPGEDAPSDENRGMTLRQGRENYRKWGAVRPDLVRYARPPRPEERPDAPDTAQNIITQTEG